MTNELPENGTIQYPIFRSCSNTTTAPYVICHMPYAICHMRFCKSDDDYDCDYDSIINYQIIDINN